MAKLVILCGLPGSGKSYYAEQLCSTCSFLEDTDTVIHSSDAIRKELFGDAGSQENSRYSLKRDQFWRDESHRSPLKSPRSGAGTVGRMKAE